MQKNIIDQLKSEINDFLDNEIEIVPGYSFNQYENIKKIHLYENGKFLKPRPYNGRNPIFYNISTPRRDSVDRFLDIDTKDFNIIDLDPKSEIASKILGLDLKRELKQHKWTKIINRARRDLSTYGSIVLKHIKGMPPMVVDLRRLFLDPTVDSIEDSRFVIIKHYFTPEKLRKMGEGSGWDRDSIEKVISVKKEMLSSSNAPYSYEREFQTNNITSTMLIEVYERWGYDEDEKLKAYVVAEPYINERNKSSVGVVLYESDWKELPFMDCHFVKIRGRWQGVGVIESLFPIQQRLNEIANQKRISMELSAMHLFQTADLNVVSNVLDSLENGSIIISPSGIQPIANEERNLPAFQSEQQDYISLADKTSFSNDFLTGGDIPSSMPATNAVIQQNNITSIHLQKRENYAFFWRDFVNTFVQPDIVKGLNSENILRLIGSKEDFAKLDDAILKITERELIISKYLKDEPVLSQFLEDINLEAKKKLSKMRNKRFVKTFKGYLDNKKYDIDINIDNEQKDVARIANNTFNFLQVYASNPQFMQDPVGRELMLNYGRSVGIDTAKIELAISEQDAQRQEMQAKLPNVPDQQEEDQMIEV